MKIAKFRGITVRELGLVFVACAFPIHVWSILNLLDEIPAWVIRLSVWDLIGFGSYTQSMALFESLIVTLLFILLALILPRILYADKIVSLSAVFMLVISIWSVVVHHNYSTLRALGTKALLPWMLIMALSLAVAYIITLRSQTVSNLVFKIVSALAVLTIFYVILDVLTVALVLIRNL